MSNRAQRRRQARGSAPDSKDLELADGVSEDDVDEAIITTVKRLKQISTILQDTPVGEAIYIPPGTLRVADVVASSTLKNKVEHYLNLYGDPHHKSEGLRLNRVVISLLIDAERNQEAEPD